jgi:hypothetical protein
MEPVTKTEHRDSYDLNVEYSDDTSGGQGILPIIPRLSLPTKSTSPQRPQTTATGKRSGSNQRNHNRTSHDTRQSSARSSTGSMFVRTPTSTKTPTSTNTPKTPNTLRESTGNLSGRLNRPSTPSDDNAMRLSYSTPIKKTTAKDRISRMFTPPKSIRVSKSETPGSARKLGRANSAPGRDFGSTAGIEQNKMATTLETFGLRVCDDDSVPITIEDFNQHSTSKVIITSPRSIEACLRTGIPATDLIHKPESAFAQPNLSRDIINLRYIHYEQKRLEKIDTVINERLNIMEEDDQAATHIVEDDKIAAIEKDKQQVEKALKQTQSHMEQLIAYEISMKKKALETERKLRLQKQKDDEERKRRAEDARQRELARIKKHMEHKLQTEKLQEQHKEQMAEKQRQAEEREKNRKSMIDLKQKEKLSQAEALKKLNEQRVKNARLHHAEYQNEIMNIMEYKEKEKQRKMQEFEESRKKQQQLLKEEAQRKEQKVQETKQMANAILQTRINKINEKREETDNRQRESEQKRQIEEQKKKIDEENREVRRMEVIEAAKKEQEIRIESLLDKQKKQEEQMKLSRELAKRRQLMRMEEERLKEQDRIDLVERTKRMQEFKQMQTLAMIEEKRRKVELIEREKQALIDKKVKMRVAIERTRHIISGIDGDLDEDKIKQAFMTALSKDDLTVNDWQEFEQACKTARSSGPGTVSSPRSNRDTKPQRPPSPLSVNYGLRSPASTVGSPGSKRAQSPTLYNSAQKATIASPKHSTSRSSDTESEGLE